MDGMIGCRHKITRERLSENFGSSDHFGVSFFRFAFFMPIYVNGLILMQFHIFEIFYPKFDCISFLFSQNFDLFIIFLNSLNFRILYSIHLEAGK